MGPTGDPYGPEVLRMADAGAALFPFGSSGRAGAMDLGALRRAVRLLRRRMRRDREVGRIAVRVVAVGKPDRARAGTCRRRRRGRGLTLSEAVRRRAVGDSVEHR